MARDLRPKHKLCRKFGEKLCDSPKCPLLRRSYPPGIHGPSKKHHTKLGSYGKQLLEKQKVKRIYGILERQFSNYVAEASKKTGDTSKFLLHYLESRLDNVVYRSGLANSRAAARQLVTHGHVLVNGKKLDIASYRVRVGETVGIKAKTHQSKLFENRTETIAKKDMPSWLSVDAKALTAKVLNSPTVANPNFDANSIIGFYSR
ncbi:MAG: 30S ribosomal protein S4 [Candidatus Magasanikbacteria bacterium]|nr:30S ribosomal protein S4 [Candidatus Magasanikbacteria bacterium]